MVVRIRDADVLLPNGAGHRGAHKRFHGRPAVQAYEVRKGPLNLSLVIRVLQDERLCLGHLADGRSRSVSLGCDTDIFRVVGYTHEVHRRVDRDVVAHGVLDGLALRVLESVIRAVSYTHLTLPTK